ncbi:hypothetical protein BKA61DRAFT_11228 [Leptodontidium sp. MPI-SDFR-AT-0119]|nr:hypothetical protein BKA61DRAFT_11228 [Leptodontidium sp. MPI-SDFR-AT-0119]
MEMFRNPGRLLHAIRSRACWNLLSRRTTLLCRFNSLIFFPLPVSHLQSHDIKRLLLEPELIMTDDGTRWSHTLGGGAEELNARMFVEETKYVASDGFQKLTTNYELLPSSSENAERDRIESKERRRENRERRKRWTTRRKRRRQKEKDRESDLGPLKFPSYRGSQSVC